MTSSGSAGGKWPCVALCSACTSFEHEATELAYLDALAAVDGLTARRGAPVPLSSSQTLSWP